jgi:hypothetical protein
LYKCNVLVITDLYNLGVNNKEFIKIEKSGKNIAKKKEKKKEKRCKKFEKLNIFKYFVLI